MPHDDVEGAQGSPGAGSVNVVGVNSAVGNGGQTQWIERGGSDCLESLEKKKKFVKLLFIKYHKILTVWAVAARVSRHWSAVTIRPTQTT